MKYLALIYANEGTAPKPGTAEFTDELKAYKAASAKFQEDGVMLGGDALESVATATTVRVRNGKTETMDGPFVETKEQLGGYYMFDVETLDEAIKYASMIPSAKRGSIEVRPLMIFD